MTYDSWYHRQSSVFADFLDVLHGKERMPHEIALRKYFANLPTRLTNDITELTEVDLIKNKERDEGMIAVMRYAKMIDY